MVTLEKMLSEQKIYRAELAEAILKKNAMISVGKRQIRRAKDNYKQEVKSLREKYMRRIGK